jgi:hypothetical protein
MMDAKNLTDYVLSEMGLKQFLSASPLYCTTGEKPDLDAADISVM